jgi:tetratricopeptide (TPR) repeat protein
VSTAARLATIAAWALALAWVLACALAAPARAQPGAPDPAERFARATDLMAAGEHGSAAEAFVALARDQPGSAVASDALFTAAKLYEERLIEPARALELYRRLLERYPDSRAALAARRRAEALARLVEASLPGQPDGKATIDHDAVAALSRFTDIFQNYPRRTESESLAMAEALVAEHPGWSGLPRVFLWMADVHLRAGRFDRAQEVYLRAAEAAVGREGETENLFAAYRGAGDAALARGDHDAAGRYFRNMPTAGDPGRERGKSDALAELARERLRARLYRLAFLALALVVVALATSLRLAAGSWPQAWRVARRPPVEVIFMAPIVALLIAASLTSHYAIGPAVTIICAGGLVITWLSGAGLRAGAGRVAASVRARALAHAAIVLVAVAALCYIAIHYNRLIDMIIDTVRFGPDV